MRYGTARSYTSALAYIFFKVNKVLCVNCPVTEPCPGLGALWPSCVQPSGGPCHLARRPGTPAGPPNAAESWIEGVAVEGPGGMVGVSYEVLAAEEPKAGRRSVVFYTEIEPSIDHFWMSAVQLMSIWSL